MHIKRIHEMVEKLTECTKSAIENDKVCVGQYPIGDVVDMIKDLSCAEKDALIAKAMQKEEEEEKEEEKYLLKRLKEDYKDEYKEMQEQYGDDADRRFYDSWRHADGTFARKGTGEYRPRSYYRRGGRRGYEEMPYMMMPEMYNPEYYRDMDRMDGKMYYSGSSNSGGSYGGNSGGSSYSGNSGGNSGGNSSGGTSGGSSRSYTEGYNAGDEDGYQRGYSEGNRDGRRNNGGNSSRYDRARRGYEESKGKNGNSQEGNSENMKNLEKLLNIIGEDVKEFTPDMSPSEKAMAKQKIEAMARGIQ